MHMRLAARVRAPGEGAVREGDFQPRAVEQDRPELRHLFALGDRVGCDEADTSRAVLDILPRLDEPPGHIVQRASGLAERRDPADLGTLSGALELGSDERRIAEHVTARLRRQEVRPIHFERVGVQDVGRGLKWNADVGLTERQAEPVVHDVIHHPHRRLGDARRKLADLNAVELIDIHDREQLRHNLELLTWTQLLQNLDLQGAQLAISNDEEVAAAGSRNRRLPSFF